MQKIVKKKIDSLKKSFKKEKIYKNFLNFLVDENSAFVF